MNQTEGAGDWSVPMRERVERGEPAIQVVPEMHKWRTGRTVGRTIYWQLGDKPSMRDILIGVMDTRLLASVAVAAVNAHRTAQDRCASCTDPESPPDRDADGD